MEKKKCTVVTHRGVDYPCNTSLAMKIISGKWKSVILYYLEDKTLRFNELKKLLPAVTEKTLSLQLKALEEDGVIDRKVYNSKPPLKVEYSLTDFGKSLMPIINSIGDWGDSVVEKTTA